MGKFLRLVNGVPKMMDESAGGVTIYDTNIDIVSGTPGAGELQGPISAGTPITLPDSKTYEDDELEIYVRNMRVDAVYDYAYEGDVPRTQISFTFDLEVGDVIRFRIDRSA